MAKKKEPRSGDFDRTHFKKMTRKLKSFGFEQVTRNTLERDALRLGLVPPTTERIKETRNQVSFQKEKDGYKIVVHTTYDPKIKRFTRLGCGWVLIVQDEKRLYARFFYRTASFTGNILKEAELLSNRLENRPLCSVTRKLMVLHQTSDFTALWKSPEKDVMVGVDFYENTPKHLQSHVQRLKHQKRYYENIDRPRKKITKRKKDSRKKWTVGKPENAIH
jgi:hypothetical protein